MTNFKLFKSINQAFKFAIVIFLSIILISFQNIKAEELDSGNYKISGFGVNSGGGEGDATNYRTFYTLGTAASDDRFISGSYAVGIGQTYEWQANVPLIDCFGAAQGGGDDCFAMNTECGFSGCYDRAKFEIDPQNNPTDGLYSVQIKKTSDIVWSYISSSFTIEDISTHDINDYLTEAAWELPDFNILGLAPGTSYDIRATALNGPTNRGDFTESGFSPVATAETSIPTLNFDLDIADAAGVATETSGPYAVSFGLLQPTVIKTATNLIWIDVNTNAEGGAIVAIRDQNTGLLSSSTSHTIPSSATTVDLASVDEGFGLQNNSLTQSSLGPLTITSNFDQGGNIVGGVYTTLKNIYTTSSQPINGGRGSLLLKIKSDTSTPAGSDYQDVLTFTMTGTF